MPSPFPGMNPYLEHPELWPEVHHLLISIIAEYLNPLLLPKYRAGIEKRIYELKGEKSVLVGIPDVTVRKSSNQPSTGTSNVAVAAPPVKSVQVNVPMPEEVRESFLEIRELSTGEVITVIEVLSPTNKRSPEGRQKYESKRQKILGSQTHLVEIDLLRDGEPMPFFGTDITANYRILISRGDCRPTADLYLFNLPDAIPSLHLPLKGKDPEPILDLQTILNQVYDRAGYEYTINYNGEPVPALSEAEAAWIDNILKDNQLRS